VPSVRFESHPELVSPALVCAFSGWNDGGEAATSALTYIRDRLSARRFAHIDPEDFFDFQVARPRVRLADGVTRILDWPTIDFFHARAGERDVVLLLGIEPNLRWPTFTREVLGFARELGVEVVVSMGAFLADVPHTLVPPTTGAARDPDEAQRIGLVPSRYEGPTGIVGVLHTAAVQEGFPAISLWTGVPHYLPGGPNPRAALALVRKLSELVHIEVPTDTLERAAEAWETQINEAVEANDELREYVRQLEEAAGQREDLGPVPSGDTIAAEIERFLRQRPGDPS
jgi:predicted ATP-grasp superfamily ATP-dependent carboligase